MKLEGMFDTPAGEDHRRKKAAGYFDDHTALGFDRIFRSFDRAKSAAGSVADFLGDKFSMENLERAASGGMNDVHNRMRDVEPGIRNQAVNMNRENEAELYQEYIQELTEGEEELMQALLAGQGLHASDVRHRNPNY